MAAIVAPASRPTPAAFEIVPVGLPPDWLASADPYSASLAFTKGSLQVKGDLVEAVRWFLSRFAHDRAWRARSMRALGRAAPWRLGQFWRSRARAARDIRFHYDRSNDFYRCFLDAHMVYSCAYFRQPGLSLADAQLAKLDHICHKLLLTPGDRFLDIGCGWGALLIHAASHYGVRAAGCTLSASQAAYARQSVAGAGLGTKVTVADCDYRDVRGPFDKIASVGMFEHLGRPRLEQYFRSVFTMLAPNGMFLNHGITMPASAHHDAQGLFIAQRVFPGGCIVKLADVIEAAERAGFETLDVENLRRHYALTCRCWVDRLARNRETCIEAADAETWRTWQLYLAGSAVAFDDGGLGLHQVLFARKGASVAPMTRAYMYGC
ncbi:MAG: class I SAM-dependent methyltransferase [Bryobacteraceae bacterium]